MVLSCETSGCVLCGQKVAGDGRKKETGKTKEEAFGRCEGGHALGSSEGR